MSNDEWHLREFSEVLNFTASPPRENVLCIFPTVRSGLDLFHNELLTS
jgi:hypothetical protein